MARFVMHLDMDAFFAAIEQRDHPEYRGRPVVVGAWPGTRGVVATCSYEARKFGVHSALPISEAFRRCPDAVFLQPNHRLYVQVSGQVMEILRQLSPLVEPISIDEAFVDVSGLERLSGPPEAVGREAKRRIHDELGLSASVGIGPNRLIAKLASDFEKPDGLTVVPPDQVLDWLGPMPVGRLRGVGPRAQKALVRLGINTVAQLRRWTLADLTRQFGDKWATALYHQSRGIASDHVGTREERKSLSKEVTFNEDVSNLDELLAVLLRLAGEVGRGVRREGLRGRVVTLKIRLAGFETHTRQVRLAHGTCSDRTIYAEAKALLLGSGHVGRPVRLIGLGLSDWEAQEGGQLDMPFVDERRDDGLFAAVDRINRRFGKSAVTLGPPKPVKDED